MTNNLQDRFRERFLEKRLLSDGSSTEYIHLKGTALEKDFLDFTLSEVEQAKKDLINQLLQEAPRDRDDANWYMICNSNELKGFNESNNQWRTLLESKLK